MGRRVRLQPDCPAMSPWCGENDPVFTPVTNNRLLVTIEGEGYRSERHFSRDYRQVFEPLGFRQVEQVACGPLNIGLNATYLARVFTRTD
jgi:hypothetical protein